MDTKVNLDDATILVVDDNKENLKVISNLLRQEDYKLALALSAKQALAILEDIKVDLILLDVMMPEINGYELCKIIKSKDDFKEIPVIFITALNDTKNILMGFENGGIDYITKPFRDLELLARVKTHLTLSKTLEKLESTIRSRDKLHAIIAHDLRSPLGSIQMVLQALKGTKIDEQTFNELVYNLSITTKETSDLLENLLNWSRDKIGEIKPTFSALILEELVQKMIESFKSNALQKKIKIINSTGSNQYVYADPFLLRTVLRNLMSNAIKFTDQGGTIDIDSKEEGNHILIRVNDTGVGIKEDALQSIFNHDKFYSTPGTQNERGSGLGLKICHNFILLMNGEIMAKSSTGGGSIFTIKLSKPPDGRP